MSNSNNGATKEYDIYRDSLLRYLGYSNEVGEAFRPLIHRNFVNLSYGVAVSYVLADCYDKSSKVYEKTKDLKKTAIMTGDVFLWQMLASVIVPGFTINRITTLAIRFLRKKDLNKAIKKAIPTGLGLTSIPFIIKPIDHFIDYVMDNTYRKYF
ncbi:mitochondrial fission process protein 1 [Condylostylus longicornis]|uniref:mitochondrial fission process protein 1 n=1 Tax=Condylostylus longicornis TaxID=2530218 RepID=UPI00244DE0A2|nr:mitochondrial fission process protein 1 [Condylostylus longicornis]